MMTNYIDNLLAFKVMYSLVTPFEKTRAYELGVIDKDGTVLIKIKDQTSEQKESYTLLDRLVFSLKRLLAKLPGGKSQIASLAAAYFLVKESYENKTPINEIRVRDILRIVDSGVILAEEQLLVERFLEQLNEEDGAAVTAPPIANKTGPVVSTDVPVIIGKKKTRIVRRQ